MKSWFRLAVLVAGAVPMLLVGPARATVILDADFEPPTYTLGYVGGQDGWSASVGSPHLVSNAIVHSGTQSLNGVRDFKDFDAPFSSLGAPWYVEAWCYTQPMEGSLASHFSIGNGLNEHFWIELRGDGQLTFYSTSQTDVRVLGPVALNKWLRFKVEYIAHPYFIRMSVIGDGVNETKEWGFIAAGEPSFVYVGLNSPAGLPDGAGPYWDDILVTNESPVPAFLGSWGALKSQYR